MTFGGTSRGQPLEGALHQAWRASVERLEPAKFVGRVTDAVGTLLRVTGLRGRVGEACRLRDPETGAQWRGEIVGFSGIHTLVTPFATLEGVASGMEVHLEGAAVTIEVGDALLGRVLDGFGGPIDQGPPLAATTRRRVNGHAPDPLRRRPIRSILSTGVRAIDALLALGEGQRIGLFAPAGVGKSSLLGMIARGARADVIVVGLVGERGREVREFIEDGLGPEGVRRAVVVVATSDRSAMERATSAQVVTAIAEHFREQGRRVLLLLDSLTRYARAQREIGLAAGEPPARRGYPPSLFAALPRLLERAGQDDRGSITAIYTVLTEGEESADPVAEELRAILDGHIVLSEQIAAQGRFPAIDVLRSRSRLMARVASRDHQRDASRALALLAKYQDIELLMQMGEFRRGHDPLADTAADRLPDLRAFLAQPTKELSPLNATLDRLRGLVEQA